VTTATTLVGVIGDVRRFPTARHLAGYLGVQVRRRASEDFRRRMDRLLLEQNIGCFTRPVRIRSSGRWKVARLGDDCPCIERSHAPGGRPVVGIAVRA
jgi:transposase